MKYNQPIQVEDAVKILTYGIGLAGFLSIVRHIGPAYSVSFILLYLFSAYCDWSRQVRLPRWSLNLTALFILVFIFLWGEVDDPLLAAVEALLLLLGVKFLEEKKFRDYMQIYLIVLLLLAGLSLLSTDIQFLIFFIAIIFLITVTVVCLIYVTQDNTLRFPLATLWKILSRSSLITLIALPLTALLFVILPRSSYPFLHFLNRSAHATTGFSENVDLGTVSNIQEDTSVIFRVAMERIPNAMLYWRGITLDYFDGTSWSRISTGKESSQQRAQGKRVRQTIYLEPYGNRYLFALDKPSAVAYKNIRQHDDLTYSLPDLFEKRIEYHAVSVLSDVLPVKGPDRETYLQLPGTGLDRIRALVKELSSEKNREDIVKAILYFLRDGDYRYSLENLPLSETPLEDFLFGNRYGNCEYFASAMAVMLRAAGIPSRVIGGYRGGYYNETGGYYLIPQKNAHVWVEAFLEEKGWLRVDPTPGGIDNFVSGTRDTIFFKTRLLLDSLNYYWNAMVINYDFSKQATLWYRLKAFKKPSLLVRLNKESLKAGVLILFLIICTGLALYMLFTRRKAPEQKILLDFLKTAGKHGYSKKHSEGLEEFVERMEERHIRETAFAFVREYENYFYRDRHLGPDELRRLKQLLVPLKTARKSVIT